MKLYLYCAHSTLNFVERVLRGTKHLADDSFLVLMQEPASVRVVLYRGNLSMIHLHDGGGSVKIVIHNVGQCATLQKFYTYQPVKLTTTTQ